MNISPLQRKDVILCNTVPLTSGDMSSPKISTKGESEILHENEVGVGKKGWIQQSIAQWASNLCH